VIAYSPGWACPVALGSGQELIYRVLSRAVRHPSRTWHRSPRLRDFGRSPGTVHRGMERLRELGLIATQSQLGCEGFVRFTFLVNRWITRPAFRPSIHRIRSRTRALAAPGQLVLAHSLEPPAAVPRPYIVPEPRGAARESLGECQICGALERVRPGLIRQLDGRIASGPRCIDHAACAARAAGA